MARRNFNGLAGKVAASGLIGLGGLAAGSMSGCLGPLMQGYGIQTGNAGLAALGAGTTQLQAAQIRAQGEKDAAGIYSGNNIGLNQASAVTSLDQNKPYFFVSDSPWTDLNLNGWYESNEFGAIRNDFFVGKDDSLYFHVFLPKGRSPNERMRVQGFDFQANKWMHAEGTLVPGKDCRYFSIPVDIRGFGEENMTFRAMYGEEEDMRYRFSQAFMIGRLDISLKK